MEGYNLPARSFGSYVLVPADRARRASAMGWEVAQGGWRGVAAARLAGVYGGDGPLDILPRLLYA